MKRNYFTLVILFLIAFSLHGAAQSLKASDYPLLGAQVFIEPGQTDQETELWFKTLHDNGMNVCRIRMFEGYMRTANGWDFSLFDRAFRYAEKYDIKVFGTMFPQAAKDDIGGWKFPKDQATLDAFAEYIKQMATHFKQFKSLYGWVLMNEPGGGFDDTPFLREKRAEWNRQHPQPEYLKNGYPALANLQEERFEDDVTSWMLQWISNEIRKYDTTAHLHVNNHNIFLNLGQYRFTDWRSSLNSLGGSAHASWHFVMFPRKEYDIAMSADCELLHSGAGNLPWFMTEIQGGNNTFSGNRAMCPTKEEISQWLWIILGTEGKGGIFWTLNPRSTGGEAGEWSLLDFQHQPTDRVQAIASVSNCIQKNKTLFASAKKVDTGVSILYIRESMWTEKLQASYTPASTDGRMMCMSDMLGYFKALSEIGITPNFKAFEEYDFSKADYSGQTIILANQLAIPSRYVLQLESFVSKGGKLIADGLTGYYDENVHNQMLTGFPLQKLFGGNISEFKKLEKPYSFRFEGNTDEIPGYGWIGTIRKEPSAQILYKGNEEALPLAVRNSFGKGEVVWIPSVLGAGWTSRNTAFASFVKKEIQTSRIPFCFDRVYEEVIMKELQTQDGFITIAVNKSNETQTVQLQKSHTQLTPEILYADKNGSADANALTIHPEETLVIHWK